MVPNYEITGICLFWVPSSKIEEAAQKQSQGSFPWKIFQTKENSISELKCQNLPSRILGRLIQVYTNNVKEKNQSSSKAKDQILMMSQNYLHGQWKI